MVKAGCWGEDHCQLHRFFGWNETELHYEAPYRVKAGDCYASENVLKGSISISEEEAKAQLNPKDLRGVADVKNHIAHCYISVDDQVIWDVILKRLPELINQINSIK